MRGKTIQVFLTDGSSRGIKLADITALLGAGSDSHRMRRRHVRWVSSAGPN